MKGGLQGKQPSSHSRAFAIPGGKKKAENLKGSEGGIGDRERVGIEGNGGVGGWRGADVSSSCTDYN